MYRRLLAAVAMVFLICACVAAEPASKTDKPATLLMSAEELKIFCLGEGAGPDLGCKLFIQGVIETWMYRDVISVDPEKFSARNLAFCANIYHSSEDEWKRIVRAALSSADMRRAASYVVMKSLHDELCKDD